MAFVGIESTSIRQTGTTTTVAQDDIARLMYYLNCVNSCLEGLVPDELRNYQNYSYNSEEQKKHVVLFALLAGPEILVGKVFFPVENGSNVLDGCNNNFFEISKARQLVGAIDLGRDTALVIDGKTVDVQSIMVCNEHWLRTYYVDPLKRQLYRAESVAKPSNSNSNSSNAGQVVRNITIECGESRTTSVPSLNTNMTGSELKALIQSKTGIPVQRVYIKGLNNEIQDNKTLAFYEISHNDTLVAFPLVKGGN